MDTLHRRRILAGLAATAVVAACSRPAQPPAATAGDTPVGVLLVAHGSKSSTWTGALEKFAEEVRGALAGRPGLRGVELACGVLELVGGGAVVGLRVGPGEAGEGVGGSRTGEHVVVGAGHGRAHGLRQLEGADVGVARGRVGPGEAALVEIACDHGLRTGKRGVVQRVAQGHGRGRAAVQGQHAAAMGVEGSEQERRIDVLAVAGGIAGDVGAEDVVAVGRGDRAGAGPDRASGEVRS